MTNQPDESHPLRDRVDEAISWFTQTDEPTATPVAEESAPAAAGGARFVEGGARFAEDSAPVVGDGPPASEPIADVTPEVAVPNAPGTVPEEPVHPVAPDEPSQPVVPTEPAPAEVPTAPLPAEVPSTPLPAEVPSEPTAAAVPASEPAFDDAYVAPERAYEADEFSSHPVSTAPVVPDTSDVATERVSEAEDFMPPHVAETPAVIATEPVAAEPVPVPVEPVPDRVESSSVDEPTRIHPIEPPSSWAEVHPEAKGIPEETVDSEAETTAVPQRSFFRDEAPTVSLPFGAAAVGAGALGAGTLGAAAAAAPVPAVEQTAVLDAQEAARVRREERAARDRQLGKVIAAPDDSDEPLVQRFTTPSTYKALPSLGFLLFRWVIATVVGIRAWQHLTHLTATREMWAATIVPSPGIVAYTQIGLEIAIAIMLFVGLGTRIAGLALLVLSVGLLVFVQWGVVSPFQPGASDFIGVVDVMLAGAGLLLATVGGGRIAFDGFFHTGRIRRKNDKLFS